MNEREERRLKLKMLQFEQVKGGILILVSVPLGHWEARKVLR